MFQNYFTIALRTLLKQRLQTVINILGLAVGITGVLVTFVVLQYEFGFDGFHTQADRTYRMVQHNHTSDGTQFWNTTAFPLAAALRQDFPNLEVTQTAGPVSRLISSEDAAGNVIRFEEERILFVDPYYLQLFDFAKALPAGERLWLEGERETAFAQPNSVILTKKLAQRYFPAETEAGISILGKTLKLNNKDPLQVTGVVQNPPANTNLLFEMLIPYEFFRVNNPYPTQNWSGNYSGTTYVRLPEGAAPSLVAQQIASWKKNYLSPLDDRRIEYRLQALTDIHTETLYGSSPGSYVIKRQTLGALAIMALFLIIIACANFINLATARLSKRSKEVGVRKVLGGTRWQLARQFVSETALLAIVATLFSLLATEIVLNQLNQLFTNLHFELQFSWMVLTAAGALAVAVTLFAGLYPALVFSNYAPVQALKNRLSQMGKSGLNLRRSLIVLQFGLVHLLIVGTIIVALQMRYIQNKDLGFQEDAIVTLNIPQRDSTKLEALAQRLRQHPTVQGLSFASGPPMMVDDLQYGTDFRLPHEAGDMQRAAEMKVVDLNYLDLFDLELVAGRWLSQSNVVDRFNGFIVNETLVQMLGFTPEEALGKEVVINEGQAPIIGVIKDFNNNPLQEGTTPCLLFHWNTGFFGSVHVQLASQNNMRETLAYLQESWTATFPEGIYQYHFLDDQIARNYLVENLTYRAFQIFALLAIFIGCLGLYGLLAFIAESRTKEIGIRKVLGANVLQIVSLLSQDFLKPVLLAIVLATPIAWYVMQNWLQHFAYRIPLHWGMFVAAALLAIVIALLTVSGQSVRAALANPVESLKNE